MAFFDDRMETLSRKDLESYQFSRLQGLLGKVMASDGFYREKYRKAGVDIGSIRSLKDIKRLPFTEKKEFENDQISNPPFGTALTEPLVNYVQYHQTTGTTGRPLRMLDTKESWDWRGRCCCYVLSAAGVSAKDTMLFAFNFGPYTAFWVLYEGACKTGCLVVPTGGWTTEQRVEAILENRVTVVAGTPTYVLRLAAAAAEMGRDLGGSAVHTLVLSGERGAMDPGKRAKIESAWGAKCYDFIGQTEVGSWGFQCERSEYTAHILESEFIAEIIDPETGEEVPPGEEGELVLTNLGRGCNPAIRFRSHDIVKASGGVCGCGRTFRLLAGGVLGRQDEMVKIRGINLFPSSVGLVVEKHLEPGYEYQIIAFQAQDRDEMKIVVEGGGQPEAWGRLKDDLGSELKRMFNLGFRIEVVDKGSLPRYEYKAKRFVDRRGK